MLEMRRAFLCNSLVPRPRLLPPFRTRALTATSIELGLSPSVQLWQGDPSDTVLWNAWDYTQFSAETIDANLADAMTYRMLVQSHGEGVVNIKDMRSFRDNVTRKLAPTVARAFATRSVATGHPHLRAHVEAGCPSDPCPSAAQQASYVKDDMSCGSGPCHSQVEQVSHADEAHVLAASLGGFGWDIRGARPRHIRRGTGRGTLVGAGRQGTSALAAAE